MREQAGEIFRFRVRGHPNIRCTHKTTLEFTKHHDLTLRGDCVFGVRADFDHQALLVWIAKQHASGKRSVAITITVGTSKEAMQTMHGQLNAAFSDENEIVVRTTDFISPRTLATRIDKSAAGIERELVKAMHDTNAIAHITLEACKDHEAKAT